VVWEAVERVLNDPSLIAAELERRREGTSTQQADLERERQHYKRQLAQCDKDLKRWEARSQIPGRWCETVEALSK